jgi:uncharacterized protein (DUF433 family)
MGTKDDRRSVIAAFSEGDVSRLTGISERQLGYWDTTGFFKPSVAGDDRRLSYSRVYSFRDVVCLQVLNALRNEAKVPLPHLREVKERLSHLGDDLWAKTTLYVLKRRVVFFNEETDRREEIVSGQGILQIPLQVVRSNMEQNVRALWTREPSDIGRIEQRRNVVGNRKVIAGTRIPVSAIQSFSDAGYTPEQIRQQYPTLADADIEAALLLPRAA